MFEPFSSAPPAAHPSLRARAPVGQRHLARRPVHDANHRSTLAPDRLHMLSTLGLGESRITALAEFKGAIFAAADGGLARLDLQTGVWAAVLRLSPGGEVTGLAVAPGASEAAACLYATWASPEGGGLMWSEDGLAFTSVLDRPGRMLSGLRAPVAWGGHLAFVAFGEGDGWLPEGAVLLSNAVGYVVPASELGFGDPENLGITALAVLGGRLHAATQNDQRGFQLWVSQEGPEGEIRWARALTDGAHRFGANLKVAGLAVSGDDLYIGTSYPFAMSTGHPVPAAELLRLERDGHWEVIAGEARFSPQGLKVPVSLQGPGFGDRAATCIVPGSGPSGMLATGGPGGAVWLSRDGENWEEIRPGSGLEEMPSAILATAQGIFLALGGTLFVLPAPE